MISTAEPAADPATSPSAPRVRASAVERLAQLTEAFRPGVHPTDPDTLFRQLTRSALPPELLTHWGQLMRQATALHHQVDLTQQQLGALDLQPSEEAMSLDELVAQQWRAMAQAYPNVQLSLEPLGPWRGSSACLASAWGQMLEFVAHSAGTMPGCVLQVRRRSTLQGSVFDLGLLGPSEGTETWGRPANMSLLPGLDQLLIRAFAAVAGGDARLSVGPHGATILFALTETHVEPVQTPELPGNA